MSNQPKEHGSLYRVDLLICFFASVLASAVLCAKLIRAVPDIASVDYRALSEAKLAVLTQAAMDGKPVNEAELKDFLLQLNGSIDRMAQGRLIFVSGTVLSGADDITEKVAGDLGLDLSKNLVPTLSNMANRVDQALQKGMTPKAQQAPALKSSRTPE